MKQLVNPQRWNRYAYVVNNPLALYDPDGQDDQGKGGSKVIDVFIAISAKELKEAKVSVAADRLKQIADKNGYELNVYSMEQSTVKNVTSSLKNSTATFVLGHSGPITGETNGRYLALQDGDLTTTGVKETDPNNPNAVKNAGGRPEANGDTVAMLGCGTQDLGLVVEPKNEDINYVTLDGSSNHVTTVNGGVKAMNALVEGYMTGGVQQGIDSANRQLRQNGRRDKRDRGDKLQRTGAMTDVIEIKIPPL